MRTRSRIPAPVVAGLVLMSWHTVSAQQPPSDFGLIDGTIVFLDAESDSRCGAVNTFNADFIIRSCDRRLVLLSGDDRETPYSVTEDYTVIHDNGLAAGNIRFASDNDGARQVFWLSDDNFQQGADFVLTYVSQTDQLLVATVTGQDGMEIPLQPINISQTQCDPLATFDGGTDLLCPRTCGTGGAGASLALMFSLGLLHVHSGVRRRARDRTL